MTGGHIIAESTLKTTMSVALTQALRPLNSNANHNHATLSWLDRLAIDRTCWLWDALLHLGVRDIKVVPTFIDIKGMTAPLELALDTKNGVLRLANVIMTVLFGKAILMREALPKRTQNDEHIESDLKYRRSSQVLEQHSTALDQVYLFLQWWKAGVRGVSLPCSAEPLYLEKAIMAAIPTSRYLNHRRTEVRKLLLPDTE